MVKPYGVDIKDQEAYNGLLVLSCELRGDYGGLPGTNGNATNQQLAHCPPVHVCVIWGRCDF